MSCPGVAIKIEGRVRRAPVCPDAADANLAAIDVDDGAVSFPDFDALFTQLVECRVKTDGPFLDNSSRKVDGKVVDTSFTITRTARWPSSRPRTRTAWR